MGSLRLRLAVPVVGGMLLVAALGWGALHQACQTSLAAISGVAVRNAAAILVDVLRTSSDDMGSTLGALARDRQLTDAVAARDHGRLLAIAGSRYQDLRVRHRITHWNYWEPEHPGESAVRNLIRFGMPSMRGDLVEGTTIARVAHGQALASGLELGSTGFVLRVLAPVREGGRVAGYAELGREIGTFLADLKARTGDDFGLVLDKRLIDPRGWAASRAAIGERNDWYDREDVVVAQPTGRGDVLFADIVLPAALPDGGTALGLHREGGKVFARGAFPVRDVDERKAGAIYVVRDVTDVVAEAQRARRGVGLALASVALGAAAVVGAAFELLVVRAIRRAPTQR